MGKSPGSSSGEKWRVDRYSNHSTCKTGSNEIIPDKTVILTKYPTIRYYLPCKIKLDGKFGHKIKMDTISSFCIIADVIGSRGSGKAALLPEVAEVLNSKVRSDCLIPFTLRAGDELFAVFSKIQTGYHAFRLLYRHAREYRLGFYVGMGIGKIDGGQYLDSDRINGPAIWRASDALDELKREPLSEVLKIISKRDFRYNLHGSENSAVNLALETYLYFVMQKVESRTVQQNLAIQLFEEHPDWTNAQLYWQVSGTDEKRVPVANATANFSKLLARANYHFVREAEESLMALLQSLSEREKT